MKTAIIAVSRRGIKVAAILKELYPEADIFVPSRFLPGGKELNKLFPLSDNFCEALAPLFSKYHLLAFISAAAIAVRAIAPCLKSKDKDPAVVAIDEQARFVISLLSGHLGGANAETEKIAHLLSAQSVITTATDNRGITAFDEMARRLGWQIDNLAELKKISAALLEEREVYLYSERSFNYPLMGKIIAVREADQLQDASNGCVLITSRLSLLPELPQGVPCLMIRPRSIAAGVGCRRGMAVEAIIAAIEQCFKAASRSVSSLACLATGEFKADEDGLCQAADYFRVPLKIFARPEIAGALEDCILSDFVEQQVGVGAVAEPCARLASGSGEIIMSTRREKGITLALAEVRQLPFNWQNK